ncbi:hypothetical protein Ahy_A05g023713 [Arachis hypogaea]|uniref:Uncharacterized protein n=2 Tax=Arachis hypogaea TaxID=3818 RepID=A0A445D4B0_ARAHY|nr:hypothetical protein Ahy_A05g023713 [Arachis hypogaea]
MSGYSSAVKLEIEKFDGRINFGLWQVQVKDVLIQSGRWLKNFQEKPIWKLHHEFSARFRSVPRRNSWSGLIPNICFERVWVYWGAGERKKSMCCNNFHIVIFSGCHLTTAVVFSPPSLISLVAVVVAGRQCDSYTVATMSGYSSAVKLEIEKFDGRINFGLWQVQVKDVLIQSGLHKALKEKISGCSLYERR